jgi:hypothetical protein
VPSQSECGRLVAVKCVALLTVVQIRGGCELSLVLVAVAVETAIELDLEHGFFAAWDMALRTLQSGVLALQWIRGSRMFVQSELGRLESFHAVTGVALRTARAFCELSLMLIAVTIHALLEGEWLLEITIAMAGEAVRLLVLPRQGKLGPGMIKVVVERRG